MRDAASRHGPFEARLGPFALVDRIATGGMAEIFVARREEPGRPPLPVIVKRVLPHLAEDEQFVTMFIDEARIASALDHPNLVRILDVGREEDSHFIAMELVPGEPLSRVLSACASAGVGLEPTLAAHIVAQAAAALHHAHQLVDANGRPMRIVHRDVSPDNVLVSFAGGVKVIDFGIARAQGRLTQTQHGVAKGKFAYMSPEQARGLAIDHRTDIFALGVVLWESLAGRRLFQRGNERDTIRAILNDPVPPLAALDHVGPIGAEFDEIVARALARDLGERFPSAEHLRVALEQLLERAGLPTSVDTRAAALGRFARELLEARYHWWRDTVRRAALPDDEVADRASSFSEEEAPTKLLGEKARARSAPSGSHRRWRWAAGAGAAAVVLLGAGALLVARPERPPPRARVEHQPDEDPAARPTIVPLQVAPPPAAEPAPPPPVAPAAAEPSAAALTPPEAEPLGPKAPRVSAPPRRRARPATKEAAVPEGGRAGAPARASDDPAPAPVEKPAPRQAERFSNPF